MAAHGASASHFARWLAQEARADKWASYGALAMGLVGLVAAFALV